MKVKIGLFSFTCCEGCTISFIEVLNKKFEEYMKKIEIVNARVLRPVKEMREMDIAFVEGAISTESEIKKLKEIRSKTAKLVALGSGAVNGYPSDHRNKFDAKKKKEIQHLVEKMHQIEKISPLKTFVKVDDEINGCPVDEKALIKKIEEYLG